MPNMENRNIAILLFIFTISVYCLIAGGHYGGDAVNNYLTTESMMLNGNIRIDNRPFEVREIRSVGEESSPGSGEHKYSQFGIGMPLLQIPFFLKGLLMYKIFPMIPRQYATFFCVSFTNCLMSALNSILLYTIMVNLGFKRRHAVYLALIYSITTMAIVYSKTGFTEPALITFLLITLLVLFKHFGGSGGKFLIAVAGASFGFMCLIKSYSVILFPAFAVYIFVKSGKRRIYDLAMFILPFGIVFSADLALNYVRFGGLFKTGYGDMIGVGLGYGHHFFKGLYYYWLSSGKGFFLYNIPLVMALFCWRSLCSKRKEEFWLIVCLILIYVLYFAYFFKRGSIFSWGPRYLFPIAPLFIFLMEGVFNKKSNLYILTFLAAAGFLVQIPAVVMNYSRYIYFVKEQLKMEEYMINYVPDLSHIKGCWDLLIAFIQKQFWAVEHIFTYSPDPVFVRALSAPMSDYAVMDLWYINIARFGEKLITPAVIAASAIGMAALLSGLALLNKVKKLP